MGITVGGTTITFNDGTTQTTAAGGVPSNGGVGAYANGFYAGTANPGDTVAGSSLYRDSYSGSSGMGNNGAGNTSGGWLKAYAGGVTSLGLSGTWRAANKSFDGGLGGYYNNLWVRIS